MASKRKFIEEAVIAVGLAHRGNMLMQNGGWHRKVYLPVLSER